MRFPLSWKMTLGQKFRGLSPPSTWYAPPMARSTQRRPTL